METYSIIDDLNFNDENFVYSFKNMENEIRSQYKELRKEVFEFLLVNMKNFSFFQDMVEKGGGNIAIYRFMNQLVKNHDDLNIKGLREIFNKYDRDSEMLSRAVNGFIATMVNKDDKYMSLYDKYNLFRGDVLRLNKEIMNDVKSHINEHEPYFSEYKEIEEIPHILH